MGIIDRLLGREAANRNGDDQPGAATRSPVELLRPDRLDPFLGDRELRAAFRVLVDGDWRRLERFLEVSPKGWMFGPIVTGEIVGMETVVFERWVEHQHSPRSRVFLANALIRDAFLQYRTERGVNHRDHGGTFPLSGPPAADVAGNGSGPANGRVTGNHHPANTFLPDVEGPGGDGDDSVASMVDEWLSDDDEGFITKLSAAEELLYEVISERPAMAEPWVALLISGRGLQVDLDELRERFENVHSRDPFRPDGCRQYLQGLTKKWGGSNVASFDLARWLEQEAPTTSAAREALPMAHIERGLLQYGIPQLSAYLSQPEVVAELSNGLLRYLQAIPSPAPTQTLPVLNAYVLALSADNRMTVGLLTDALTRIENRPTEWPWSIFSDDVAAVFAEIQADQLRNASRF